MDSSPSGLHRRLGAKSNKETRQLKIAVNGSDAPMHYSASVREKTLVEIV